MNNLEKYLDQVIEQKPVVHEPPAEASPPSPPPPVLEAPTVNVLASVRRRWHIVLATTVVLSLVAVPAVVLLVQPQYLVQGAVRVAPVVQGILGDEASTGEIGAYGGFVNTQAIMLMSDPAMLAQVADDLVDRNLDFLSGRPQSRIEKLAALVLPLNRKIGPERMLSEAISKKKIQANSVPGTELITVNMRSSNSREAMTIVDSFLNNYVVRYGSKTSAADNSQLILLSQQATELQKSVSTKRENIDALARQYGSAALETREEMEMARQGTLLGELTRLESERIRAEANVAMLESVDKVEPSPEQVVSGRREFVNSDPTVAELTKTIVAMERDLIIAQQTRASGHWQSVQMQTTLDTLKKTLEDKRAALEQEYDSTLEGRMKAAAQQRLTAAKMELEQIKAHYGAFRSVVDQQDTTTREVGMTNLAIQNRQFELRVEEETYDRTIRRIKALEMEQQRPARVEHAYAAHIAEKNDRRPQLATAAVLGAFVCGIGLALLRDRADQTLQTPEDITRHLDLPVLGTTTSSRTLKPALFAEQIAGDYQTIRTNLGLLNEGGMPRRLVVSSAGVREGKTTFAVNLATSLAKSGKKVLLIDGDLRKPDVGQMLKVPKDTGYLQDVLLGGDVSNVAYVSPSSGLHVLAANPRHLADPYELLTSSMAAEQIERLARDYDHLIIDSPPALAFPDALVWAKLADAIVLVGFAGQTTAPELREARERFARGRARVLGAVLSNVPLDQSLYRYAYTYRVRGMPSERKAKKLLLASQKAEGEGPAA